MQPKYIASVLLVAMLLPLVLPMALAQQYGSSYNSGTLEQNLKLAKERVMIVHEHPGAGSGTPFLDANGIGTAIILSAAAFGTLFVVFVIMAKKMSKPITR